jgi:hypothetical protein
VNPHWPLVLQVAPDAPLGTAQAVQDVVPHELGLLFDAQVPLQSWVPLAHWPLHDDALSMQAPAQGFCPFGQLTPHTPPWQVAEPPVIPVQAEHDDPQVAGEVSLTHLPPHRW